MTKKLIRVMAVEDSEATTYLIKRAFSGRGEKVDWDLCLLKMAKKLWTVCSAEAVTPKLPCPISSCWTGTFPKPRRSRRPQ
jgi:hypothetical protein